MTYRFSYIDVDGLRYFIRRWSGRIVTARTEASAHRKLRQFREEDRREGIITDVRIVPPGTTPRGERSGKRWEP